MTDKQIKEIMALVDAYGNAEHYQNDGLALYKRGLIESALRAVPAIPEGWKLVPSVPTNEWIGNLAKQQSGSLEEVPFLEIHQCIAELLEASPQAPDHTEHILGMVQAPQPATPRKPLFEDLIALHKGLREELLLQDAQPVQPACPVCNQTPVFKRDRRTGEWAGSCKHCGVEGRAATTETEARRLWIAWHHKRSDATPALFNTPISGGTSAA